MKDWNVMIGNRISELLAIKNWKQADLIATGCVKRGHLSHVINGSVGISLPSLIDICNALDVSLSDFFKPLSDDAMDSNGAFQHPAYLNPIIAACHHISEEDAPLVRMLLERLARPVVDSSSNKSTDLSSDDSASEEAEESLDDEDEEPKFYLPLLGGAAAGSPIYHPADDGDQVAVPEKYSDPDRYAVFQARGDSMEPRIPNGAFIVTEVNVLPADGEVAVVMLSSFSDAEYVVKRIYRKRNSAILRSYNPKYTDMEVAADEVRSAYRMVEIIR